MSKLRRMGDVTADLEDVLLEMAIKHDMQWGEIIAQVHNYLMVHCPGSREEYSDGTHPQLYYGPAPVPKKEE